MCRRAAMLLETHLLGKYCLAIGEDRGYNRNDVEKTGINVVLVTAVTYGLAAVFLLWAPIRFCSAPDTAAAAAMRNIFIRA